MHSIADDVTSLVLDHHGSFSGEHGDGLARTEFNPKMYGPQLWAAFQDLKTAFDPDWRMNPGTVVFRDEEGADMREHLRYGPEYSSLEPTTAQDFSDEGGFSHLVELCNGCGTCRQTGSETMCPTYRGMKDEMATTRGRANMLRAAISGEIPTEELYTDRFQEEVLDLCLGCKGCARDCPTGVDLAKLKAEVKHAHHEERGPSRRDRFFANMDTISALGSALAPVSNWATKLPGSDVIAERLLGIAPERDLPSFSRESFEDVVRGARPVAFRGTSPRSTSSSFPIPSRTTAIRHPAKPPSASSKPAGVHVQVPSNARTERSGGLLEGFLDTREENAREQRRGARTARFGGWSVVFVEPSDAVMFQDEYQDLLSDAAVELVGANTLRRLEFVDRKRLDDDIEFREVTESLSYHGHCNQKAIEQGPPRRAASSGGRATRWTPWRPGVVAWPGVSATRRTLRPLAGHRSNPVRTGRRERRGNRRRSRRVLPDATRRPRLASAPSHRKGRGSTPARKHVVLTRFSASLTGFRPVSTEEVHRGEEQDEQREQHHHRLERVQYRAIRFLRAGAGEWTIHSFDFPTRGVSFVVRNVECLGSVRIRAYKPLRCHRSISRA